MSAPETRQNEEQALRDYLNVMWRRKWQILAAIVTTTGVAYAATRTQQSEYRAQAQVVLTRQDLLATVTGAEEFSSGAQPDRLVRTLADLARVPAVAQRALAAAGVRGMTPDEFLESSSVAPKPDADVINFAVKNPDRELARRLATAYANQFRNYRNRLETVSLNRAQANVERRLDELARSDQRETALYGYLLDKSEQLQTLEALQNSDADVVHPAGDAVRIRPRPMRNALAAAILGLLMGIGLAFLFEAFDTSVRTVAEIRERLGLPILGRIPGRTGGMARTDRLVMLTSPQSLDAEPFRVLRTNLDLVNLHAHAKTIMFASAYGQEGKSTTIANLAVALARSGRSVAVVDCDLRRPSLHHFFGLEPSPGLTDVVLGKTTLEEALRSVTISGAAPASDAVPGNGGAPVERVVHVLLGGPSPLDLELIGEEAIGSVLRDLEAYVDCVLVDAAPLLPFGEALALSARMDGVILVVRLNTARDQVLSELRRVLDSSPAKALGVVITGAPVAEPGYYAEGKYALQRPESPPAGRPANL